MLWTLFKTCFIISGCTFGGGMVIISMLQKKFVEELKWISQEEVMDLVAIAQSCPGVMAVNTSIIIGYRIAGVGGALLTVAGTVLPPMIILTIISTCYVQFRSNQLVALILKGMQAGVAAVMINVTLTMSGNVLKKKEVLSAAMLVCAAAAILLFDADVILVIIVCGCISGAHLVLGLYYGSAATMEEAKSRKPLLLEKVAEFERRFSQTQPHRLCRDILGMDITQPGVMREAAEKGLFRSVCGEMTKRTCDILADMLDEEAARKAAGRESDGSGDAAGQGK